MNILKSGRKQQSSKNGRSSRRKILIGNWKMNPQALRDARKIIEDVRKRVALVKSTKIIVCPPSIFLCDIKGTTTSKKIEYGVQNIYQDRSGAFTGEISASMSKSMGAEYAIVGHSERRARGETNDDVAKKVQEILREGMTAVVCVGEKEKDEHANHLEFVRDQVVSALRQVPKEKLWQIIIAYEPVYAIGASQPVSSHEVYERNIFIKKVLCEMYGKDKAFEVPVLYGGSVNDQNAAELVSGGGVDGLLVGRQSIAPESFAAIAKLLDKME
jgi:triosephosphate isomerase